MTSHHSLRRTDAPTVDVGIPTHGEARYLRASVESVLAQSLESWRLMVSVNGETADGVARLLEPYLSDPRISIRPVGSLTSRQANETRAIAGSTAPYVAVLHDDDLWDRDFVARRVDFLDAHPTCGFVFSPCRFIGTEGEHLLDFTFDLPGGVHRQQEFFRLLYRRNFISMPTVLTRRSAYERVGGRFNESVLFSDYDLWLRIAAEYDVGLLDGIDASYRIHAAQETHTRVSRNVGRHRLEVLDAVDPLLPPGFPALERRRARSAALLRASKDAFAGRAWREGFTDLRRGVREHPLAVVDPKMLAFMLETRFFRTAQRAAWNTSTVTAARS